MTYQQARDAESLNQLDRAIAVFISRYLTNLSNTNRRTIILFPGGMGSQLLRASTPHPNGPPYSYSMVWLDCSVLFGSVATLQMHNDVDLNDQIIVPDGPVQFLLPPPYYGFIVWCNQMQIDYLIFGWDWRRDLSFTADFFLCEFMPLFEQRIAHAGLTPSPLQNLSLVGHSQGGTLVKLIMNRSNNRYVQLLKHAVTVGSPFYGYGGQLPRYFIGDPDLNSIYGNQTVTRIISSLAGNYSLQFLDQATFARDGAKLTQDPYYPGNQYPVLDTITGAPADPYNPQTNGMLVRYPQNYGFDPQLLNQGKATYDQVAALLDPSVISKFFNIRGVTTRQGAAINKTVTHQTWGWINPNFDPNKDPCPITDHLGHGDGTLPAWSTVFAQTPTANVRTVRGAQIDHMFMMSNSQVLGALATVI